MKRALALTSLLAAVVLGSCDGPKAGELLAELTTPSQEIAAVAFTVRAVEPQTIDTVTAGCSGCQVYLTRVTASEVRGVLTGQVRAGPALRIMVSNMELPEAYQIQLLEAAGADFQLLSLTGSSLAVPVLP